MPTPQDVRKKGSKILKLPPVHNCFTLTMTNKLFVIINSFKVPKIEKILLYEMKFLVPNYSCLQNPWLGGYHPQIPILSVLNWICWTSPGKTSWVRHWPYCVLSGHYVVIPYISHLIIHQSKISTDSLRAEQSGDRIPVGGEIFHSLPQRQWGQSSLLYNRYWVFLGGEAAGAWSWPPTPSSAEVKEGV